MYAGSLADRQQLANFFPEIRDRVGSIGGVIHSAGISSDLKKPAFIAKDLAHIAAIEKAVMEVLKLSSIDRDRSFQNYGLDSISATQLAIKLEKRLDREILPQWLIDYPTIASQARPAAP